VLFSVYWLGSFFLRRIIKGRANARRAARPAGNSGTPCGGAFTVKDSHANVLEGYGLGPVVPEYVSIHT
jgi:hypothetical protein